MIKILKSGKQWYFKIVAKNGKTLCHSETYKRKRDCIKAANTLHELTARVDV